jgi:two-component system LytT family response regulator
MRPRILVAEDEPLVMKRILRFLEASGREFELATASSGLEAVEQIAAFQPDIVFLDVEMPGLSGFEVLAQFDTRPFRVVFHLAYRRRRQRVFPR